MTANHTIAATFAANTLTGISVTAPTGTPSLAPGAVLPVTWTASPTIAVGEFGIWIVSPSGIWTLGKVVPASGAGANYVDSVVMNVPAAAGYQIYVYYRATPSSPWGIYGLAPGTVTVAGFSSVSVTAPAGPSSVAAGGTLPVTWTTNATVSTGEFGIWIVSAGNIWTLGKVVPANGASTNYPDSVVMNVPTGVGYQIYVYYRLSPADPWGIYGLAPGLVTVL